MTTRVRKNSNSTSGLNSTAVSSSSRLVNRTLWMLCGLLAVASVVGCSPDGPARVHVSGQVTLNGAPLKQGSIEFIPLPGTVGPKAAAEIIDGHYELSKKNGPVIGTLRVEINAVQQPGFALDDPRAHAEHVTSTSIEPNLVPPEYNQQSTLTRTTTADGPNEFDFTITTTGERR